MDNHLRQAAEILKSKDRIPLNERISAARIDYDIWFDNHGTQQMPTQAKRLVDQINTIKSKYDRVESYATMSLGDLRDLSEAMEQLSKLV